MATPVSFVRMIVGLAVSVSLSGLGVSVVLDLCYVFFNEQSDLVQTGLCLVCCVMSLIMGRLKTTMRWILVA